MADTPRKRPYVYTTWITKLLSGEAKCLWAAWYKSHHKYEKVPDDFPDREAWQRKHDALVNRREEELIKLGWVTRKEDAAEFTLRGTSADLAGKPDLVAMQDDRALIIDAKSGKPKRADHWQVLIYCFALPLTWLKGFNTIIGEVERNESENRERVRTFTGVEKEAIVNMVRTVSGEKEPEAAPGPAECRYCDILGCPHRYKKPTGDVQDLW